MTLEVDPTELRSFGSWLDLMVGDAESAISYTGHTRVDDGGYGNLMLKVIPVLDEIHGSTESMFRHLRAVVDGSANEIFATARHFEDTDKATAAALDATYPR